ncbi:Vascular endothelial growth factor homolog [Anthophora retusa]
MMRDRRLLLLFLVLLMAYGLFVVEARHRGPHEDTANDQRHRHRHRHESSSGKRDRHDLADRRSPSSSSSSSSAWSQDMEDEGEDDYDARPYYERSYPRGSRIAIHGRMFEPRSYPPRYHRGGYRGGTTWYDEDDERHRGSPRYTGRSYRLRTYRKLGYPRNRDADYEEDEFDYEKPRSYEEDSGERYRSWWKNGRKHRIGSRYDWRSDGRKRHRSEDFEAPLRRFDDWRRRSNESRSVYSKNDGRRRVSNSEDYEYEVDDLDETDKDEKEEDDETEEEDPNEYDDELDNDFYKTESSKPPLKTYDDIIRRLTSDDPTTPRPTVKRDYRNIETDRYTKQDPFGYFKYEPKNLSRPMDRGKISSYANTAMPGHQPPPRKLVENLPGKLLNTVVERKSPRNASNVVTKSVDRLEKKAGTKINDTQPKTKSLEQDYDEYLNTPDNEKEEDLIKAGVEEDTGMQADVTNTDYTEDENENETPATTTTSTTTTTTTTTSTTTSTPRPVVTRTYDHRDPRAYEGSTGAQYNGYQSRHDYPPMSAHSVHKWQSLGTRESVKETRSNMQQYNKNGKTAEIREALQHAIKVSREGSCQWPRPRVIPVRDVYPSPSTTYIPHCAILHRCSDDTGCCRSEALTCVPKHSHRVELSFYTTNVGGGNVVEKLSFYNHTECECRERTEYDTSNEKPSEQRFYRHHQSSPQPQNMRRAQPRKPCRCPSEFTPRITSEGECQCNCYESHQNCIKIRRGKGYFSLTDRLCIQNDECATPSCEFGEYMRRQGKCPRKKDKFDAIANYHTNLNHRYRS